MNNIDLNGDRNSNNQMKPRSPFECFLKIYEIDTGINSMKDYSVTENPMNAWNDLENSEKEMFYHMSKLDGYDGFIADNHLRYFN